ncbi:hypothetical protein K3740_07695 [Ruegeria conchae]|uniref:DUF6636 domain-containing protein n=1 Tax=Ruegeria conchae TaxID=981384 RepID=UPI0021A84BF5|nr:DUF6636 domain-containing protein [Ruegeria conchae]UWR04555.1 hypothetical protein K3740_07695 [Ruegeria conchae]
MPRLLVSIAIVLCASLAHADVWTFETPSENIQCVVGQDAGTSDLSCTIIERSGAPALPRPADCQSDWGHEFFMTDKGAVRMLCQPVNQNRNGYDRAEYGGTGTFGGFICHSSEKGLECRNEVGHGFFLSRAKQRIF